VERTEPDVRAASQKVDKVLEENKANEERIKVLRREYETACDNQDAEELVGFSLACCVVTEASVVLCHYHVVNSTRYEHRSVHKLCIDAGSFIFCALPCEMLRYQGPSLLSKNGHINGEVYTTICTGIPECYLPNHLLHALMVHCTCMGAWLPAITSANASSHTLLKVCM
jgi:hypothetical protein